MKILAAIMFSLLVVAVSASELDPSKIKFFFPEAASTTSQTIDINVTSETIAVKYWETVPGIIRNNATDSFILKVDPGVVIGEVFLDQISYGIKSTVPFPIQLKDDGISPDEIEGDNIYTAGPFFYDDNYPMAANYMNDPNSPIGIGIREVGRVRVESDTEIFLVSPYVGILEESIPATPVVRKERIALSNHLINVQQEGSEAQKLLRSHPNQIRELTKYVYKHVTDNYDFFVLFSTLKIERNPFLSRENFNSGAYLGVRNSEKGAGMPIFNHSSFYGSSGALRGVILLDTYARGLYSNNLFHELLHHWGGNLHPDLGLCKSGEYNPRSSVGSLLGGQSWVESNGSYTIDCENGRNGAFQASPLDLYTMGLLPASEVSPIMVYNDNEPLPLHRCGETVTPVRTVTIDEIIAYHGIRTLNTDMSIRIAFVVESNGRMLNDTEMTFYNILAEHVQKDSQGTTPYAGFNWVPITKFFGDDVSWTTLIQSIE